MPIVYAWKIKEGLCHWATTSKVTLMDAKPSSEAKIVKCFLLEYKDYLNLLKLVKEKK